MLRRVYEEGMQTGHEQGFIDGVEVMRRDLIYAVADELENIIASVPGVGKTLQSRIVEAVHNTAERKIEVDNQ